MIKNLFITLTMASWCLGSSFAAESHLSQCKIGTVISGKKYNLEDLKGKVVVIEEWGVRCAPCLISMTHLVKLDRWYGSKGLVVIANEAQSSSQRSIRKLVQSKKVKYTVTQGTKNPWLQSQSIPQVVVFDVQGRIVFRGSPRHHDFDRVIKQALKSVKVTG